MPLRSATVVVFPSVSKVVTVAVVLEVSVYPVEVLTKSAFTPAGAVKAVVEPATAVNLAV